MNKKNLGTLFIIGNTLGQFGSSILSFVLGLYILKTLNSVFLYSTSQVIGPITALLLLPVLGSTVDKFDKNKIIKISQSCSCIAIFIFYLLHHQAEIKFLRIILLLIVLKFSDQFLSTTLNASTLNVVGKEEVQSFRSKLQLIQALSMVLSPIFAVLLYQKVSLTGVILLEFFIELFVLFIFWKVNFQSETSEVGEEGQPLLDMFREGIIFIYRYKKILFGLIFVLMINFLLGIINVGLPFIQINVIALSEKIFAYNESILAFGLLLGSLLAAKIQSKTTLNLSRNAIMLIGLLTTMLGGCLWIGLSKISWMIVLMIYFFSVGLAITVCNVLVSSWSMVNIPQEYQGRVFSILNAVTQTSLPVSMLLFGYLFDWMPIALVFIFSGILLIFVTLVVPVLFGISLRNDYLE